MQPEELSELDLEQVSAGKVIVPGDGDGYGDDYYGGTSVAIGVSGGGWGWGGWGWGGRGWGWGGRGWGGGRGYYGGGRRVARRTARRVGRR